jgi:hypothetical protein
MVKANAKHEMSGWVVGQMPLTNQGVLLLFGAALFVVGLLLMYQHRREWIETLRHERKLRNLKFELKKFRRRALVGSLLSALGAIMAALHWVFDPTTFVVLTVIMFLLLIVMLGLGLLDLLSVWLHEYSTVDDRAKQEMVQKALELHEARKSQATSLDQAYRADSPSTPQASAGEFPPNEFRED